MGGNQISKSWNDIISTSPATIYHLREWGRLLENCFHHEIHYLSEKDGVLPVAFVKSRIFGNRLISVPFADYGGPCTRSTVTADKLLKKLLGEADKLNVNYIEIRAPREKFHDTLIENGFIGRDDYSTFILPLDKELDKIHDSINNSQKRAIKKARKNGITVKCLDDETDIEVFYNIYLKTMKRLGSPPQGIDYMRKLRELFYPSHLKILASYYENVPVSAALFLMYGDTIHYYYGSSLKEYNRYNPNSLLFWEMITWGHENDYKYLDFGRTRSDTGVWAFKKSWGGYPVNMKYYYKFYGKAIDERDELRFKSISRLWSRYMPENVTRYLGPVIIRGIG